MYNHRGCLLKDVAIMVTAAIQHLHVALRNVRGSVMAVWLVHPHLVEGLPPPPCIPTGRISRGERGAHPWDWSTVICQSGNPASLR